MASPQIAAVLFVVGLILSAPAFARRSPVPVLTQSVVAVRVSGRVSVEVRGEDRFVNVAAPRSLPVGSTIDATQGVVKLVTADITPGSTQRGLFNGGAFVVSQDASGLTTLRLVSGRRAAALCGHGHTAHAAALNRVVLRLLHGTAHGRFRTSGRYGAATVLGTRWTTIDSCDGTKIDDTAGQVATQANDGQLSYALRPGQQVVYRCAAHGQPPVSRQYCVAALLAETTLVVGVRHVRVFRFSTGVVTRSSGATAQLCVRGPRSTACTTYPLQPVTDGLRDAVASCYPTQGPGGYFLSWRVRGVALGVPLTFRAPIGEPFVPCSTWAGQPLMGSQSAPLGADIKTVNPYSLPTVAHGFEIRIFLRASGAPGQQVLTGLVYADSDGTPGALVGTTQRLTFSSRDAPGWYDLTFARHRTPKNPSGLLVLRPGRYWIGVIAGPGPGVAAVAYDVVPSFQASNANPYTAGPTNPFGAITVGDEQLSMYLQYYAPPF